MKYGNNAGLLLSFVGKEAADRESPELASREENEE